MVTVILGSLSNKEIGIWRDFIECLSKLVHAEVLSSAVFCMLCSGALC